MNRKTLLFAGLCFGLFSCTSTKEIAKPLIADRSIKAEREFRAAWVATVANINWPSKPGLSTEDQQKEAIALLDFLQINHFNAVILQVRPQCDALYNSDLEPWSYFLTGEQGKAPSPYYDPLQFWVDASHARGIELHVWLNPYRAHHKDGKEISAQSIVKKHPEMVYLLKEGYWWLDPAQQETINHTTNVVMDIVKRYDIDGVHFDDYFYPYPSYNGNVDFPDSLTYVAYQKKGGKLERGDWRRDAVNRLVEGLYKKIKSEKPWVKFGLSPFGIWRPGFPPTIEGFDQYDQLYADARLWLNKGWIDYFSPQLYWPINRIAQSYPVLLEWWSGENTMKRHLWPGISVGRDTALASVNETLSEIMISRGILPDSKGVIHWSISSDIRNPNLLKALAAGPYKRKALVPPSPWLDKLAPEPPSVSSAIREDQLLISWTHPDEKDVFRWVIYYKYGNLWDYRIEEQGNRSVLLPKYKTENNNRLTLESVMVTAVDRVSNESRKIVFEIPK